MSRGARIALLVGLAAVAVASFLVLRDGGSDESEVSKPAAGKTAKPKQQPRVEEFTIANGAVAGGPRTLSYEVGDVVRIQVATGGDLEEVHVHGYDATVPAVGKEGVRLQFVAKIDGAFEIEAHGASGDIELGTLEVRPG